MDVHDYFNTAENTLEDLYREVIKVKYPSIPGEMIKKALNKIYEARAEVMRQGRGK